MSSPQSAIATPNAAPAAQAIMEREARDEAKERHRQTLQALIEAAAVTDPTITQRVTVAAVWQYFRLPDDSFGWSGKKRDDGTRPPMPVEAKGLCILTTLALNLMPGVGHVLWLGNKAYVTADARRYKANSDRELVYIGKRIYRPFNDGERAMFALEDGDMHCVIEQRVRFKGEEMEWVGFGLIGKHELDWRDKYDNRKAGMQSKKDCAMHLITRAERDMLNRFYPVSGLPDAPDDPHAYEDADDNLLNVSPQASPVAIMAADDERAAVAAAEAKADEHGAALMRFGELSVRVEKCGANVSDVLEADATAVEQTGTTDQLNDCGDALEAWLAEHEPPAAPPPASPEPPKKGRGRPKKNAAPAPEAAPQLELEREPEDVREPERDEFDQGEAPDRDDDPSPADVEFTEPGLEEAPPPPVVDRLALPYTGTEEQKAHLRAAADVEGFKADGDLWALAGAMKGRPMRDVPTVLGAFKLSRSSAKPAAPAAPAPAAAPTVPPALRAARDRLSAALRAVGAAGGAHMKITGGNTVNLLGEGSVVEIEQAIQALEGWLAATQRPKPAAPVAAPPPAPAPAVAPKRAPALELITRVLTGEPTLPAALRSRLEDLSRRTFREGDHLYLPRAIREGKAGNFRELDELIGSRDAKG